MAEKEVSLEASKHEHEPLAANLAEFGGGDAGATEDRPAAATEKAVPAVTNETAKTPQTEMSTKEAYFASLDAWVKAANVSQNAMALFPWYLFSSYPQIFQQHALGGFGMGAAAGLTPAQMYQQSNPLLQQQQSPNAGANNNHNNNVHAVAAALGAARGGLWGGAAGGFRILDDQTQAEIIARTGGYEYIIAPFWKRAVAEIIDVLILLLIKVMLTFTIMNLFDLDLGFDLDKEVLRKAIDEDDYTGFLSVSMDFLAFSSDLLMLEVLTKVIVCFYEAIWTTFYGGATPGKALMNLRIQYVEAVLMLQPPPQQQQQQPQLLVAGGFQVAAQRVPMRALIFPGETPGFRRAFLRAVAKNLIITLLFPMCFIMIFFKNNRTAYDILTKTIVVEDNPNRVLRHQQR